MSPGGDLVRPEPDTQLRVQLPRSLLTFYARPGWPPNRSPPQSAGCTTATRCTRSLPEAAVPGQHGALKGAKVGGTQVASADRLPGQDERAAHQHEQAEDHIAGVRPARPNSSVG